MRGYNISTQDLIDIRVPKLQNWISSLPSLQSSCPSHAQVIGMQVPFSHRNWFMGQTFSKRSVKYGDGHANSISYIVTDISRVKSIQSSL